LGNVIFGQAWAAGARNLSRQGGIETHGSRDLSFDDGQVLTAANRVFSLYFEKTPEVVALLSTGKGERKWLSFGGRIVQVCGKRLERWNGCNRK
jgi:hypothetical protein